jgi:hypothetical protein
LLLSLFLKSICSNGELTCIWKRRKIKAELFCGIGGCYGVDLKRANGIEQQLDTLAVITLRN